MRICSVEGCNESHIAKGYCMKHYRQIERHGRLTPELEKYTGNKGHECSIENCSKEAYGKGLCVNHWKLSRGYIKSVRTEKKTNICSIINCENESKSKGLCQNHYDNFSYYRKKHKYSLEQYIWKRNKKK